MNTPTNEQDFHCGYVAIVGRPNVGKSTLLNCILGQKISITANRPQTTRHRILGVKTTDDCQVVYVDTPGLHLGGKKAINRFMNRAASSSITDVDMIIFVLDRTQWTDEDTHVLEKIKQVTVPVFLVVNKVDGLKEKDVLLPYLGMLAEKHAFTQMMPISAQTGAGVSQLEAAIEKLLPTAPPFFP